MEQNENKIENTAQITTESKTEKKGGKTGLTIAIIALAVVIALAVYFACFHKNKKVRGVEALIDSIGIVTIDSEYQIQSAEAAYEQLTDREKDKVGNISELYEARGVYNAIYDKQEAAKVDSLIDQIGNVTKLSANAIEAARLAYDALSASQRKQVKNLAVLELAEQAFDLLDVREVEELIRSIKDAAEEPDVKLPLAISMARKAYDALDSIHKKLVGNYGNLTAAEEAYSDYEIAKAQAAMDRALSSGEGYSEAYELYGQLNDNQKENIENIDAFEEVDKNIEVEKERAARLQKRENFIKSCEQVTYAKLTTSPDAFDGAPVKFEIKITEVNKAKLFKYGNIVGVIPGDKDTDYISIVDKRSVKEPELKVGDVITIYGKGAGTTTVDEYEEGSGWFGSNLFAKVADTKVIPIVNMVYTNVDAIEAINKQVTVTEVMSGVEKGIEIAGDVTKIIKAIPWK